LIRKVESFANQAEGDMLAKGKLLAKPEVERTEGAGKTDVRRDVFNYATRIAGMRARTRGQCIPLVDQCIQLIAVLHFASQCIARQQRQPRAAGSVDCGAGQ
jgi:hypothetical protein